MIEDPTHTIIGAAIEVHRTLGPGLLESAYENCLAFEFFEKKLSFKRQLPIPIEYKGQKIDCCYRIDFLVENLVIVELKTVDKLLAIHESQLLTYLKLANKKIGLLMNFNCSVLKTGIKRIVA